MQALPSSLSVQYQNLLDACLQSRAPSGRGLSFVSKAIRGQKHWYLQLTIGSRKTQHYLGPDSEEVRATISAEKARWEEAEPVLASRERLVAGLLAGGAPGVSATEARVLEVLDQAGVFVAGGVLVGSHAFRCYSNLLGVRWSADTERTQDLDVADTLAIGAVLDERQPLRERLLASGLGVIEVPALDRKAPSTRFSIRGEAFTVDVLAPLMGKPTTKPVWLPNLNTFATPVRWLDFVLEDPQPAVVLAKGGVLVNIPAPGRYALHKLMVAERRPVHLTTKASKDLRQAEQLIEALLELRPGELALAGDALDGRRDGLLDAVRKGAKRLDPGVRERLLAVVSRLTG